MKPIEADYCQQFLLPPCLEDWIGSDHPARFIRELVANADLRSWGMRVESAPEGRRPYSDALLLRVWLYGYLKKVRSARALEEHCRSDIGFIWLCGNQAPDHNTLWRFFARNKKSLAEVFKLTVRTALKLELVGLVLQAVDGTKIEAACSGRGGFDHNGLRQLQNRLQEQIAALESAIEQAQGREEVGSELPKELRSAQRLKQKVREALEVVEGGGARHCQPQEPEARRMKCDGRNRFGYNAQAVVDEASQIIVAEEVVNEVNDEGQLVEMSLAAAENTGSRQATTLADGGYGSTAGFAEAERQGLDVLGKLPSLSRNKAKNPYHASEFGYDPRRDEVICPRNQRLPFRRERQRRDVRVRIYQSTKVCAGCPARNLCTSDRRGRMIERHPEAEALERMRAKLKEKPELIRQRARIVEPVFAQIKANLGFRRWSYRGLESVRGQWALLCSVWNLKKLYQVWRAGPHGPPAPV